MKRRDVLRLGLGSLALGLGPCCLARAQAPEASAPVAVSPLQPRLERLYTFLCTCVLQCPPKNQHEIIKAIEEVGALLHPYPGQKFAPHADEKALEAAVAATRSLFAQLPLVQVKYSGTPENFVRDPLPLTVSLPQHVLLHVENATTAEISVVARFEGSTGASQGPARILPGQAIPLCLPVTLEDAAIANLTLCLDSPDGGSLQRFTIPVVPCAPTTLRGTLQEGDSDKPYPGRVWVRCSDGVMRHGKAYANNPTLSEKPMLGQPTAYRLPFFYSDGHFEMLLPPGETEVMLERGFEHELAVQTLHLEPGQTQDVTLSSKRFVDMKSEGWISGDTHVHWSKNWWNENEDMALLAVVQRAEDLRVVNNLTLKHHQPPAAPFIAPTQFPMGPAPGYCDGEFHVQMGEEYRNDDFYGHLNFLGIKEMIQPISTGRGPSGEPDGVDYPTNDWAIRQCRAQGGLSCEAHGLGPFFLGNVPANLIHGIVDCVDQLGPEDYYRFLDCGFRIPLGDGSDHPARVTGCARIYVKVDGGFSYENWLNGIRAKRTFVSSGPLLWLRVNGQEIGSELSLSSGATLSVEAKARSRYPLGVLQVVSNGEVIREVRTQEREAELRFDLPLDKSRWLVARCSQTDRFAPIPTASDCYTANPHIAHTSAIYADLDGRPVCKPEAAREWATRMHAQAKRIGEKAFFANEAQRQEAVAYIEEAAKKYEALITG